jgi:hypothetical protein
VPKVDAALGKGILDGIAAGWPAGRAPTLTPAQRTSLAAARSAAPADLAQSFAAVAKTWTIADVFNAQ